MGNIKKGNQGHLDSNLSRYFSITEESFEAIQTQENILLSPNLKERLNKLCTQYIFKQKTANFQGISTRVEQRKNLEKAIECAEFLQTFLDTNRKHSITEAKKKLDEELIFLNFAKDNEEGQEVKKGFLDVGILPEEINLRIDDSEQYAFTKIVNFGRLKRDLLICEVAMKKAMKTLKNDGDEDDGGRKEELALNELYRGLKKIYDSGKGKKTGLERFVLSIVAVLPEDMKPSLPEAVGSIGKQAVRVSKNTKKNKVKQSRIEIGLKMVNNKPGIVRFREGVIGVLPKSGVKHLKIKDK